MTVARIINDKGRDVVTVSARTSLAEIAATLSTKRIGAVVVMEKEAIHGIISERDIVRAVAKHGGDRYFAFVVPVESAFPTDTVKVSEPAEVA